MVIFGILTLIILVGKSPLSFNTTNRGWWKIGWCAQPLKIADTTENRWCGNPVRIRDWRAAVLGNKCGITTLV